MDVIKANIFYNRRCKSLCAVNGEVLVEESDKGEVLKVLRDIPSGVHYHVRFPGRTLLVPEKALCAIDE